MRVGSGCVIRGWGTALPDQVVSNHDIAGMLDTTNDWIVERSGIRTRHAAAGHFVPGEQDAGTEVGLGTTGQLAQAAGSRALRSAHIDPNDIDMLVVCTSTPDKQLPSTSAMIAAGLGVHRGAMDLNAACAGFLYGLVTSASLISGGMDRVLLIGAETMTRTVDWSDRSSAFLFGDGAGAVVLGSTPGAGSLLGWDLGTEGRLSHLLFADHGSTITMNGPEVFRHTVKVSVASARLSMERSGVRSSQIDLFVPHQANARIMEAVAGRLAIGSDRIASVIESTGNTSAASIPLALSSAAECGRIVAGSLILFAGFGAGLTWGSAVWRWKGDEG